MVNTNWYSYFVRAKYLFADRQPSKNSPKVMGQLSAFASALVFLSLHHPRKCLLELDFRHSVESCLLALTCFVVRESSSCGFAVVQAAVLRQQKTVEFAPHRYRVNLFTGWVVFRNAEAWMRNLVAKVERILLSCLFVCFIHSGVRMNQGSLGHSNLFAVSLCRISHVRL